jgi:hypothetical protein
MAIVQLFINEIAFGRAIYDVFALSFIILPVIHDNQIYMYRRTQK